MVIQEIQSTKNMINIALKKNNVVDKVEFVINTDNTIIVLLHLLRILVKLLYNFSFAYNILEEVMYDFIMHNFEAILDIVTTELEIALLNFINIYDEEIEDVVELHNKDECLLVLVIQNNINKKLEKLGGK